MNYYERHIGDYLKDTAHLSLLEHGVYSRLMDAYYSREAPIPEDQANRLVGAKTKEEKAAVQTVLAEFFKLSDGVWRQKRCDEVIASHAEFIASQKAKAAKRWHHTGIAEAHAAALPEHMPRHSNGIDSAIPPTSHLPLPNVRTPISPRRGSKIPLPDDFVLSSEMRSQALAKFPDCDADEMFTNFRAHHEAHGKAMKNWGAAWTTWLGNAVKFGYPKRTGGANGIQVFRAGSAS